MDGDLRKELDPCEDRTAVKGMPALVCIEEAAHGIELTEVERENFRSVIHWVWGWNFVTDCFERT